MARSTNKTASPADEPFAQALRNCRTRQALVFALREAIDGGVVEPGRRLPSIRQLQELSGLRYHEIYRALETLAAEGRIEQRHGSGTYVLEKNGSPRRPEKSELSIGVLSPTWDPDFSRYGMARYLSGISAQADLRHRVQILPSRVALENPSDFLSHIRHLRLDGLIWIKPPVSPPLALIRVFDAGVPVVLLGRSYAHLPIPVADFDADAMGEAVAEFMANRNRRKVICMVGVHDDRQTEVQVAALRRSFECRGLALPDDRFITVRIESAAQVYSLDLRESVIRFFQGHPDFDGVFSIHPDQLGVLEHLHASGFRRCPEEFLHLHYGYPDVHGGRPCPSFPSAFINCISAEIGRRAVVELEKMFGIEPSPESIDCAPRVTYDPY